jgi:hypothetical protein
MTRRRLRAWQGRQLRCQDSQAAACRDRERAAAAMSSRAGERGREKHWREEIEREQSSREARERGGSLGRRCVRSKARRPRVDFIFFYYLGEPHVW